MGLTDKLFSLLWDIFVECGPNEELLRWRLACIKGFCTDRGVEKGLCDTGDMLQEFLTHIGCPLVVKPTEWMFPNALWMMGWQHCMDNVGKHVYAALSFWPGWLKDVKELVRFLRITTYRKELAVLADSAGFDPRALKTMPPRFAAWRWATLWNVVTWLLAAYLPLQTVWSLGILLLQK